MFRRKEEETLVQDQETNEAETKVAAAPSAPTANPNSNPGARPMMNDPRPAAPATNAQPASPYRPAAPAARPGGFSPAGAVGGQEEKTGKRRILTVGNDILLKGEIATCDRLVIEGAVDAKLNDVHTVEIAETGSFLGSAEIQDAEISGVFEGELVVRNRLVIYSTGKVRGKITYGEIEIERGGELTGEIRTATSAKDKKENKDSTKAA